MFAEFRVRYPKGSLTAELVTIHEGKYVVRAMVSVENEILASSLGAAKTVELAEDRAISRVMSILRIEAGTTMLTSADVPNQLKVNPVEEIPQSESAKEQNQSLEILTPQLSFPELTTTAISPPTSLPVEEEFLSAEEDAFEGEVEPVEGDIHPLSPSYDSVSPPSDLSEGVFSTQFSSSLPITPSYHPNEEVIQASSAEASISNVGREDAPITPPVDMSDVLARTTVEIKRLGWTDSQGRNYLVKTYKKKSRSLLNDQELLEFLHYLESQPAPDH